MNLKTPFPMMPHCSVATCQSQWTFAWNQPANVCGTDHFPVYPDRNGFINTSCHNQNSPCWERLLLRRIKGRMRPVHPGKATGFLNPQSVCVCVCACLCRPPTGASGSQSPPYLCPPSLWMIVFNDSEGSLWVSRRCPLLSSSTTSESFPEHWD